MWRLSLQVGRQTADCYVMECEHRFELMFPCAKRIDAVMASPDYTFVMLDTAIDVDELPDEFCPARNAAGVAMGFSVKHGALPVVIVRSRETPRGLLVTVAQQSIHVNN